MNPTPFGRLMRWWGSAIAVAAMSLTLWVGRAEAQVVDTTKRGPVPDSSLLTPATIDAGRKIFHGAGSCSGCHGDKLQGGPIAPALTGAKWRHIDGSFAAIVARVDSGLAGTLMVPRPGGITATQVFVVATYVYAVSHGQAKP